jgi:hypothetical protein
MDAMRASASAPAGRDRGATIALVGPMLVVLVLSGCAGKLLTFGKGETARFRHRELGYEIAYPSVLTQPGWSIYRLDESDLLVRHTDGSSWALSSSCRATAASLEMLAGELARAANGQSRKGGRSVRHAGLQGWVQRLERREGDQVLEIKTVTLRGPQCTYDWILLAPSDDRLAELKGPFDAWWRSFEPGPGDRVEEGDG